MIKRTLFPELKEHLNKKEMSLIIGPRQAGKTTLMLMLKDYLEESGSKTVLLNLDIETDKTFFTSQLNLVKKIELELGKERGYVFIDEIQRKEDAGLFLKGIYDMSLPYKFIVSGSGSVELKEKVHESLAGRKRVFKLTTLDFEEFVNFKTDYRYEEHLLDFFSLEKEKTNALLLEYLNFGAYPRVVLDDTAKEKQKSIDEIYQSYLAKDISYLLGVKKIDAFSNLVKLLSNQIGMLVNISELSNTVGASIQTIKEYLYYLEQTFIIDKITPYFRNIRKEITKSPIIYFSDLGLRNYILGLFGNLQDKEGVGFLFQNFVFNILQEKARNTHITPHFWRTKDGGEVDFIIDYGKEVIPIEVKYTKLKSPALTRSLRSFIEKYAPKRAFVVNLDFEGTVSINNTTVSFIPFYKIFHIL